MSDLSKTKAINLLKIISVFLSPHNQTQINSKTFSLHIKLKIILSKYKTQAGTNKLQLVSPQNLQSHRQYNTQNSYYYYSPSIENLKPKELKTKVHCFLITSENPSNQGLTQHIPPQNP